MADTNLISIQGSYTGAVSSAGPTFIGNYNSVENSENIPILVVGAVTSASKDAEYSVVAGEYAKVNTPFSVVFNGSELADGSSDKGIEYTEDNPYTGSGIQGTFSMNLNGGLDGLYIGTDSLKTHMRALSSFTATCLSSDSYDNNIIHKSGTETASGVKTFTSSITFGNSSNNKTVISNSSININSSNTGGLLFHYNGAANPTSSLKETSSGTLTLGAKVSVSGDSSFNSSINNFNGITLNSGKAAHFENGEAYAKTQSYTVEDLGDNKVATTQYVLTAIRESATSGMDTKNNTFQGTSTFANTLSLSSTSVVGGKVNASFVNGNVYVADQVGTNSSSLAANTKFVKNIAASLSASLRDNKTAIGSNNVPVYLNNSKLTQFTGTQGGTSRPVYMNGGSITPITTTTGSVTQPVYFNNGTITQCNTMVDIGSTQTITGAKSFSSLRTTYIDGNVYINDMGFVKGQTPTFARSRAILINSSNFTDHYSSARLGAFYTNVDSSGHITTMVVAYQNQQGATNNSGLTLRISKDGKGKYATLPIPTNDDGTRYSSTTTTDVRVPTIGWCNDFYARKDGATFTGGVSFKSGVEIYNGTPYIDFHHNNSGVDYTARIIQESIGKIRIMPCASSLSRTVYDTASSIFLGTQTIGSTAKPVFLQGGAITPISTSLGEDGRPVYFSNGEIKESTSTKGSTSKPVYFNGGLITPLSATKGSTSKPVYLKGGDITELSATVGSTSKPVYLNAGTITALSSTVGSAVQPVYMNGGAITACNTMVDTSSTQTVGGTKTFSNYTSFSNGATLTGNSSLGGNAQLVRNGKSVSWQTGRDGAVVRNGISGVGAEQYCPVISTKSLNGTWDIGAYTDANRLYITYVTDSRYANGPNGVDGQITFESGKYRTVTEMPLGFVSFNGPLAGSNGSLRFGCIPYVGGTPTGVKVTAINCGKTAYAASIGTNAITVPAYSSLSYIYNYSAATNIKIYLANASLILNAIVY